MNSPVTPNRFDTTLAFEREPNKLAYAYWQSRCGERTMPSRADLDPVAMKKFTQHIGIVELRPVAAGTEYFIRRAGSRWEDVYGPMTGKYLHDFLPPPVEKTWIEAFDRVEFGKAPIRLTAKVDFEGKTWLCVEMFIAPLAEAGVVTMLLTSFVSWSKTPAREFGVAKAC